MQQPHGTITFSRMPTKIFDLGDNLEGKARMDNEVEVGHKSSLVSDPESKEEEEPDDAAGEDFSPEQVSNEEDGADMNAIKESNALTQEQQEENRKKFKDSHQIQSGVSTRISELRVVNKKTANAKRRTPKPPTKEQITEVTNHVTNFMVGDSRSMVVRTFLLSTPPPKSFWMRNVVPFLVANEGMGYDPKMWCMANPRMVAKSFPDVMDRIKQQD
jgi:hypothetical protein